LVLLEQEAVGASFEHHVEGTHLFAVCPHRFERTTPNDIVPERAGYVDVQKICNAMHFAGEVDLQVVVVHAQQVVLLSSLPVGRDDVQELVFVGEPMIE